MTAFRTATTITSSTQPMQLQDSHYSGWIFLYQTISATLFATMHNLYPVEVLSLSLRAKGMGLYSLIQGGAGAVQTCGISVGIAKVGYKIWVVYIVYNAVQLVPSYFIFSETNGLSLEESVRDPWRRTSEDVAGYSGSQEGKSRSDAR